MHDYLNHLFLNLNHLLSRISNDVIKKRLQKSIIFWFASLIIGLVAVAYSKLFGLAEALMKYIYFKYPIAIFVQMPLLLLAGWWIVKKFAPFSGGSGIPQVMAAIDLVNQRSRVNIKSLLSLKVTFVKIISSFLVILGGGVIGREGPTIQISASIFEFFYRFIPKEWPRYKRSSMIVAGAAAGLAAAFNTPLGGIVFAIEELSKVHVRFYRSVLFIAVIISGLTAQGILGPYLYLGYPKISGISWFIFSYVIPIAAISGFLGSYMGKGIIFIINWRKRAFNGRLHDIIYIIGISLVIELLAFYVSFSITGSGKDIMQESLFSKIITIKWYDFPLRYIGTLLSFTSGAAGGIFAPALSAGAAIGGFVGSSLHLQSTDTHLIVLAGMVAFLTSITRTPFTSAILVLEMTDINSAIFYLLVAGIISNFISKLVDKKSLYDHLKIDYLHEYKMNLNNIKSEKKLFDSSDEIKIKKNDDENI